MATSQQARAQAAAATQATAGRRFSWIPYLFILPHLIFFVAFLGYPFFYGIYISLFDFDFLRPEYRPFVGLQNYANLLINSGSIQFSDFWRAIGNTAWFLLYSVPPLVILALLLAVLLNGKYPGRNLFRGLYFAALSLMIWLDFVRAWSSAPLMSWVWPSR